MHYNCQRKNYSTLTAVVAFGSITSEPMDPMDKKETLNFRVSAEFKRQADGRGQERAAITYKLFGNHPD